MYNGILIGGLVYYGIVPLINELNKDILTNRANSYIYMDTDKYVTVYFGIIVFFLVFFISNNGYIHKKSFVYVPDDQKLTVFMKNLGNFCLIVGGCSLVLFFAALGGLSAALRIAEQARSFSTSLTDFMPYYASLLVIPARLVTVAPFCYWTLIYLSGNNSNNYKICLVVSFVFSFLFYLFNAGRAPILAMVLCIVVPIMLNMNIKHAWIYIIIAGIIALPILDVLDQFFVYMQTGIFKLGEFNYASYIRQLSYPINNVFHAFDIGNIYGYRWGKDFITGILDIIPGLNFELSYVPTSQYYGGVNWKYTGGTPNDIITLSVLEFNILGYIIVPLVLGKTAKFVDEFVRGFSDIRICRVLATFFSVNSFLLISNADPAAVFRGFILWLIPLAMLMTRNKKRNCENEIKN